MKADVNDMPHSRDFEDFWGCKCGGSAYGRDKALKSQPLLVLLHENPSVLSSSKAPWLVRFPAVSGSSTK